MLTPDQEKLKEAALAATPGPWEQGSRSSLNVPHQVIAGEGSDLMVIMSGNQNFYEQAKLDAAYVAAANPAAILAILAQLEQVQGWQPIETAPKGPILLLAAEFDRPGDWRIKCGGFWEDAWEVFGASWTPTRWQNLPPPPEAA